jgi:uncharacterized protein
MPLSMYELSVPVFVRMLNHLSNILDKAEAHAKANSMNPAELLTFRFYPDMWTLAEQVRAACNFPVRAAGRLSGSAMPQFDGKDDSFESLRQRIAFTVKFVESVPRAAFEGSEAKEIVFPTGDTERRLSGQDYLFKFALPNFYFHLTTAYAILRHKGVKLEKRDYLGET